MTISANPFPIFLAEGESALRAAVAHKDEIKFMAQANGTTVCSYVVSMPSTFDCAYSREARGIVFDADGAVIARPLHKFFNVNEKPSTLIEALDWTKVVRVMDKRDGSMIHTVKMYGDLGFDVKSKKSFTSDVANSARVFIADRQNYIDFCKFMTNHDRTVIFEWTSPQARIVLPYAKDDLQLLHVRDNVTGEYFTRQRLELMAAEFNIPLVKDLTGQFQSFDDNACLFDFDDETIQRYLLDLVEKTENIEGWIFQFQNGDMVKLKTKWYIERHRAMTFLRHRDVALEVLRETIDDLKSLLVGEGADISEILKIEQEVVMLINTIEQSIERVYESQKHLSKKDFAIYFQTSVDGKRHPYFGLLMTRYDGKQPDVKGWYERTILPTIPLTQINLLQSEAEAE